MVKANAPKPGRTGTVECYGLTFRVKVLDVKERYGHTRYQITPEAGSGERWAENVKLDE